MTYYLKKLAASVVLEYADTMMSRTLSGQNFRLEFAEDGIIFRIDLSGNLEPRNRGLACHRDAKIFLARHDRLRMLHVCDKKLSAMLGAVAAHTYDPWRVELGAGRPFVYAALPLSTPLGAGFSIHAPQTARSAPYSRELEPARI
jgi:hypothetical protein